MRTNLTFSDLKRTSIMLLLISVLSCDSGGTETDPNIINTADLTDEVIIDAAFQDMEDLTGVAVEAPTDSDFGGGRAGTTIEVNDNRFNCNGVSVTLERAANSTPSAPAGTITVDFGTQGCTDLLGNVRKGKLIITYAGRRFEAGSTITVTTNNYSINGIKLEGMRTATNIAGGSAESPRLNLVLEDGKATFPGGAVATRESNIVLALIRGEYPSLDKLVIEEGGTASGVNRNGRNYEVSITEDLTYKRFCRIPVSGEKRYVINDDIEIFVEFGEGTCDKEVTMTIDGVSKAITVN